MARIKIDDKVIVLAGKDRGKQGTVIELLPKDGKVMVQGVNELTHYIPARNKKGIAAGMHKQEGYIQLSKIMPICSACNKPCRVNAKIVENNKKVRACNRCQAVL